MANCSSFNQSIIIHSLFEEVESDIKAAPYNDPKVNAVKRDVIDLRFSVINTCTSKQVFSKRH